MSSQRHEQISFEKLIVNDFYNVFLLSGKVGLWEGIWTNKFDNYGNKKKSLEKFLERRAFFKKLREISEIWMIFID